MLLALIILTWARQMTTSPKKCSINSLLSHDSTFNGHCKLNYNPITILGNQKHGIRLIIRFCWKKAPILRLFNFHRPLPPRYRPTNCKRNVQFSICSSSQSTNRLLFLLSSSCALHLFYSILRSIIL